ncbi:copper resistance protein NlpE [Flavobacterium sp. N1736]|uniref:copper resistance protein NlpE n=1 Tax=Flavobacterium sp. N1736 TaxID=2986823 RepID=UPI0022257DEF|nr:copper resistance protein NlpE [Flavobacterium sp. N1736]
MNQIKTKILALAVIGLLFVSCKNKDEQKQETNSQETEITTDGDNSKNSLDWPGTYKGTIPCADCKGIEVEIKINDDDTYSLKSTYLGKEKNQKLETGTFTWSKDGSTITTVSQDKSITTSYLVGEKKLIQLDADNKIITGSLADSYILKQVNLEN